MGTRCTATTAAGRACRAWAVRGSDPPRCTAHGARAHAPPSVPPAACTGGSKREDAPPGGELAAQIDDLDARIARLGAYMDARREELDVADLCRLLDLHSKMLGRVTHMRQAQTRLVGEQSALVEATYRVLEEHLQDEEASGEPSPGSGNPALAGKPVCV